MLDILRKNSRHWLVVGIMAIVAIGLTAFFGYSSRNMAGGGTWAAKVDGETIKMGEYITRYSNVVDMYRKRLGPDFNERMLEPLNIKFQILSGMVLDRVLSVEAEKNGLDISRTELRDNIANVPYFQKDGKFNMEYYKGMLSYNRMTANEFEAIQKRDLLKEKLRNVVTASAKVSDEELNAAYRVDNQKIRLSYIVVADGSSQNSSAGVKDEEVNSFLSSEDGKKEVQAYYTAHNNEFMGADNKIKKLDEVRTSIARKLLSLRKEEGAMASKLDKALAAKDISLAAKALGLKAETTAPFSRKAYTIPGMFGSNTNDVLWSFGLGKRMARRDIGGKTYVVAVRSTEGALALPAKERETFRDTYIAERGNAEFMAYVDELRKKWSSKISYSPVLLSDMQRGGEE